jgi:hypothetical protein
VSSIRNVTQNVANNLCILLLSTLSASEDEDSDDIDVGDVSEDDEDEESDEEIDEYGPDLYKDEEDKRRQAF